MEINEIRSRKDLAFLLKMPLSKLTHILYKQNPNNMYHTFDIPKKNGGVRVIESPNKELKEIQKRLLNEIKKFKSKVEIENDIKLNISHGFEKERNIMSNARIHVNKRFVVNVDLADFFHSIHFGRVVGYFEKNENFKLPRNIATIIAQLTCFEKRLPQGAPTSPIISNLICNIFDMRMLKVAKKYRLDYTRYADDLTFSTNDKFFLVLEEDFLEAVKKIVEKSGFKVHEKKTRIQYKQSRQDVTGIIVNDKLSVPKKFVKQTRAMAHSLYSKGEFEIDGEKGTKNQLEGRFAFINQIDKENYKLACYQEYNNSKKHKDPKLLGEPKSKKEAELVKQQKLKIIKRRDFNTGFNTREKQYQKFLFYRYFFAHENPLIVTEGKTDVRYLKAALKRYADDYPSLIQKDDKGNYVYKISFLQRSKRLRYFLNIKLDGADTLKNIYNFYTGDVPLYPNYSKEFRGMKEAESENPVIFLLDNEQDKSKPLPKILKYTRQENSSINIEQYLNVKDNLYILTNPNILTPKQDCEIEDLFNSTTLNLVIDGRQFSRQDKYDIKKYYGKEIFSKYIYRNYKNIDFSNFRKLLDNIEKIINEQKNKK